MRKLAMMVCGLVILVGLPALAQEDQKPYDQQMNVLYGETHGVGLLMDVFAPLENANGLGVVDVTSGAWHSDRGKIRDRELLYAVLNAHGFTVFAVRPGSRTKFTGLEMVANMKLGIRYIRARADEYGIDPDRMGLMGASAGGHLALMTILTADEGVPEAERFGEAFKAVGVFFPPTDFRDWDGEARDLSNMDSFAFDGGTACHDADEIVARARELSPVNHLRDNMPPMIFYHGDADPLVPLQQSEKMVRLINEAGGEAELVVVPGGAHPWPTIGEEVAHLAQWFKKHL